MPDLMSQASDIVALTIEEILAIADSLERAAVSRYAKLGRAMRRVGHDELATIFEELSEEERCHVEGVERLSQELLHGQPHGALDDWALPKTFGADEAGPLSLLTPYRALSIAVRAEERAFAFWSYVASEAGSEDVRSQAEAMARQELVHAAKLRHTRRKAYHSERAHNPKPKFDPDVRRSAADIRDDLGRTIAATARLLLAAARKLERIPDYDSARLLCDIADELRTLCGPLAGEEKASDLPWRIERARIAGASGILFEAAGILERCAERCLSLLDQCSDVAAIEQVQAAGENLTAQVARLNARLYAVEPSLADLSHNSAQQRSLQADAS
jgi:rubrerythrin